MADVWALWPSFKAQAPTAGYLIIDSSGDLDTVAEIPFADLPDEASVFASSVTKAYTDFQASALNEVTIDLMTLPAGFVIDEIRIKHGTAFTGTGLLTASVHVGITGNLYKYTQDFDVKQATGNTKASIFHGVGGLDSASSGTLKLTLTTTGMTNGIDDLTAGSVTIDIKMSKSPGSIAGGQHWLRISGDTTGAPSVYLSVAALTNGQYLKYDSSSRRITSAARTVSGRLIDVQIFTVSGTWTRPTGTSFIIVEGKGGGGGGGGADGTILANSAGATGGSEGAYGYKKITSPSPSETVTVGTGGPGGPGVAGGNGTNGNDTTFGSILTCKAGLGGTGNANQIADFIGPGMAGQLSTGGDINGKGSPGHHGLVLAGVIGEGGAGGGEGAGESQVNGPGNNAQNGTGGGGGGAGVSAANAQFAGGAGGDGWMIVYSYSDDS